jgi:hypothetical protein
MSLKILRDMDMIQKRTGNSTELQQDSETIVLSD